MSLKILKAGILDSIQDMGRYGFQQFGINPTGVMDKYAATMANALVGNSLEEAVIEMHFPAPVFLFDQPAIIALAGADFSPSINGEPVPVNQPIIVNKSSVLQFHTIHNKARCYLAVKGGLKINKWLNSCSTNLKAEVGGLNGTKLNKDDSIEQNDTTDYSKIIGAEDFRILSWKATEIRDETETKEILVLPGNEWDWMTETAQNKFLSADFAISNNSDRMGYRLSGDVLQATTNKELVSACVCFGTVQLLPDGQLIILMADHQTAGGYPRPAHVISAHLSRLAQMKAGDRIRFAFTSQKGAEDLWIKQQLHLLQLQNACIFRLQNYIHENN